MAPSEQVPQDEPTLEELFASLPEHNLYRVMMRPNPGFKPSLGFPLREHLLWLKEREAEGRVVMCGMIDFVDAESWDGTGMGIFRGESKEEVEKLVGEEPFHAAGLRTNEVSLWQVNEGSLSIRVDLIANRGSLL